ncbi:hypothetical protein B296_00008797 [Ensete ventricosum]|uniref:Uncharacterized protein n=1 Tax=Ensete ventricosum TaxID=4639 RepID=A0A426XTY2_ENSVE|nr:hypothetical protein B296_00008797 [Ensete ventricosum]
MDNYRPCGLAAVGRARKCRPCGLLPLRAVPDSLIDCCPYERHRPPLRAVPGRNRPPPCMGPWPRPSYGWPALHVGWPWLAPPPYYLRYKNAARTHRMILRDSISSHAV